MQLSYVIKRNGVKDTFNPAKVNKVVEWASEGLDVSPSAILMAAASLISTLPSTKQIHEALIKAANDLVDEFNTDYAKVAARLKMFALRKAAFGEFVPPNFHEHVIQKVEEGVYDPEILTDYTISELKLLDKYLIHERDLEYAYPAAIQWAEKYLIQNRVTKEIHESPQIAIMLISMCLHAKEDRVHRINYVLDFYDAVSRNLISLPTPIMGGVRSRTRQFSSCCLIESGDSLKSINATASAIVEYVSKRAGIGINGGAIRALGSPIRGGEASHTGVIPFYKYFYTAVKSCSQGALRGGAATLFYPMWHLEVENLLVLKNNRGTEDNRIRHLDYGVQLSKLFYQRLVEGGNITLFSPDILDGALYNAFFEDNAEFERLYIELENNPNIRKKTVSALELFASFATERAQTGRIYVMNVDNCTNQGPFIPELAPVRQSNLCLEILLPTQPMGTEDEEIALCTLSAFNLGSLETLEDFLHVARVVVRALDNLLDYQEYPVAAALKNKLRRTLGIGVINYAYALAKRGLRYGEPEALKYTHKVFEMIQFALLTASNELAIERGACELFHHTKYSKGLLPIDTYNRKVDTLVAPDYVCNWEDLREDILEFGLRNSTLTALMPSETSSQISNATNGIEPPRAKIVVKGSKDGVYKQVLPELDMLMYDYDYVWDWKDNIGYLSTVAVMQKFVDQAISANTNYNPLNYADKLVPLNQVLRELVYAYSLGVKTLYYHNTRDDGNASEDEGCESGACKI